MAAVMRGFALVYVLTAVAVFAIVAGCARPKPPLRISLPPWPAFEYLHLARERGFFEQEGVEVRLVEFLESSQAFRAYDHGDIDGGAFSLQQLLHVRDRSARRWQVGLVVGFSAGLDVILARPDVADVAALRGRRIGTLGIPRHMYLLARALQQHGLTLQDVSVVNIREVQALESLRSGQVDAVVISPLESGQIQAAGIARPIFTTREIPREIVDVLAFDTSVMRERPDDVARLIRAFYRAVSYAQEHPDEAIRIMAEREHIEPARFRAELDGMTVPSLEDQQRLLNSGSELSGTANRIGRVLYEQGLISSAQSGGELFDARPAASLTAH